MKKIFILPAGIISSHYDWFQLLPKYILTSSQVVRANIYHNRKIRTVKDLETDLFNLQTGHSYSFSIISYLYELDSNSPVHFSFVKDLGISKFLVKKNEDFSYSLYSL